MMDRDELKELEAGLKWRLNNHKYPVTAARDQAHKLLRTIQAELKRLEEVDAMKVKEADWCKPFSNHVINTKPKKIGFSLAYLTETYVRSDLYDEAIAALKGVYEELADVREDEMGISKKSHKEIGDIIKKSEDDDE